MSAIVKENAHPAATIVSETIQVERESQSPTRNPKLDFFLILIYHFIGNSHEPVVL